MKKRLTINRLAMGNLKARKKQYITMIIGILMAMVLASSVIFLMFSAAETTRARNEREIGYQDAIIAADGVGIKEYQDLMSKNIIAQIGYAHNLGSAYTTNEKTKGDICWLDDEAKQKSNQIFLEGRYPEKDDEIAIERNQLLNLGLPKAKLGDTIKLNILVRNGADLLETPITKEYTLVGIVSDKAKKINLQYWDEENISFTVPTMFVAQDTPVYDGGREVLMAYVNYGEGMQTEIDEIIKKENAYYDEGAVIRKIVVENYSDKLYYNGAHVNKNNFSPNFDELFSGGDVMILVVFVMIFAACVAIINAFNSNLKDRKQQIGLMRAVGTTKRQIIKIYGREAFIISLIVTPLSILISYLLVKIALNIISDDAVISKSLVALPIAAAVNLIVVMIAAFIPLLSASRITPMQAIRNINNNRKVKTKKIKSKKEFNASKLWAKRSLSFYKGSHITVSVILAATVLFTCVSSSAISYSNQNMRTLPFDYQLEDYIHSYAEVFNSTDEGGLTQSEYQQVYAKPYVSKVSGSKRIAVNMIVDEYDDYLSAFKADDIVMVNSEWSEIKNVKDFRKNYEEGIKNNVLFSGEYEGYDYYKRYAQALEIGDNKKFFSVPLSACEDDQLKMLEGYLVDGKIDYKKLASGEEVIMVAPQKFDIRVKFYKNGGTGWMTAEDSEVDKKSPGYKTAVSGECPYKVGDKLDIVIADGDENYNEVRDTFEINVDKIIRRTVKIGAIITPEAIRNSKTYSLGSDFGLVTNLQGINNITPGRNYYMFNIKSAIPIDEEKNIEIMDELAYFKSNDDRWIISNYDEIQYQKKQAQTLLVAMISVTIIGFAICISIINNSLSSKIRESKKVIGMLRTVGADTSALVRSFVLQMLSMFGWGIGIGYTLYILAYAGIKVYNRIVMYGEADLNFTPWFSIAMTLLMFAVCSINLYSKVRKEMKNSIIENIREL